MGPPEWKRCMRASGVLNEDIATRCEFSHLPLSFPYFLG